MILRKDWLYAAMAAAALTMADISAARALWFCDIYPERCQYTASGKGYYYPLGYRLPSETPNFGAGNVTPGTWGCVATDGTSARIPASWAAPSRATAAASALDACRRGSAGGNCRIIRCSSGVRTRDEARAKFISARR